MAQNMDVLVIGAGAAGWLCAGMLAQRGARVRLLADTQAAPPASAAAAGMLAPWSEALLAPDHGHARALELGVEGLGLWEELAPRLKLGFRRAGTLLHLDGARRDATLAAALAAGANASLQTGALLLADEALLEPRMALRALRDWGRASGVEYADGKGVAEILSEPGCIVGARLEDRSLVCAQAIVLAPGAWANAALRRAVPQLEGLIPARGCLIEFQTPQEESGPMQRGEGVYLVPQPGGRLLAGASMEFGVSDPSPDPEQLVMLRDRAIALRPDLQHAPWSGRAGVRAMSQDWSPLIGRTPIEGLFLAAGMGRNGWLLAPVTGRMVCAYVFGEALAPLHAAFSPDRFAP